MWKRLIAWLAGDLISQAWSCGYDEGFDLGMKYQLKVIRWKETTKPPTVRKKG